MTSFRTVLVPHCEQCQSAVTDEEGREVTVTQRWLPDDLHDRLTGQGWQITRGDRHRNNGVHDTFGGDRLRCADCLARNAAKAAADEARLKEAFASPRVKTVDLSAKLGAGVTLSQRDGDAADHCWLVEQGGAVRGYVQRYRRKGTGTFSTGWEAFYRHTDGYFYRREAVMSCANSDRSNYLWSGRDVAAWGVLANPWSGADRPDWARRTTKKTKESTA
ncbi:hypothetical protein [Streptomyces parvus]|uniref:hypothetical protein n=1 Tax=Streptomyces parvus TaxID=66428 RepID=UPI0033FA90AE